MRVREIMTAQPATCAPDSPLDEVARLMVKHDCGALPVVDGDALAGIVTDRDIVARVVAEGQHPEEKTARDAMTTPALHVTPEDDVEDLLRLMEKNRVRRVVVVDGDRVVGMVAQADVARHLSELQTGDTVEDISRPTSSASSPSGHREPKGRA